MRLISSPDTNMLAEAKVYLMPRNLPNTVNFGFHELPNWAAMDKLRDAISVMEKTFKFVWKLIDPARGSKIRS
jgi:hypothetical protein